MSKSRRAISAVLGTAIALVIVFTVFIPLIMYLQGLQTIFMQEANRRLQYELERIHEKLEVHVSIAPPGGAERNYRVYVWAYNPGILTVDIPTLYIESRNKGIIEIDLSKEETCDICSIAPGGRKVQEIGGFYFSPGDESDVIRVKAVTARGNGFISKEVVGPRSLPYHLIVLVSNMTFGRKYEVAVELVKGDGHTYGCIMLPAQQDSGCRGAQRVLLEPQSFSDTERMVIFKVAPGNYVVKLFDVTGGSNRAFPMHEVALEIYDDMVLNLPIPEIKWPEIVPLNLSTIHKDMTLVANEGEELTIAIPYLISLGATLEPLRDIQVEISFIEGSCSLESGSGSQRISKLYPGQTYFSIFTATCQPGSTAKYRLSIIEAYGSLSGKRYAEFEKPLDEGVIRACVIERKTVVVGIEEGKPITEEIQYVRCPP